MSSILRKLGKAFRITTGTEVFYKGLVEVPREQRRAQRAAERLRNAQLRQRALEETASAQVQAARVKAQSVASGGSIGSSSVAGTVFSLQSSLSGQLGFLEQTNSLQNQIARYKTNAQRAQSIFDIGVTALNIGSKFIG